MGGGAAGTCGHQRGPCRLSAPARCGRGLCQGRSACPSATAPHSPQQRGGFLVPQERRRQDQPLPTRVVRLRIWHFRHVWDSPAAPPRALAAGRPAVPDAPVTALTVCGAPRPQGSRAPTPAPSPAPCWPPRGRCLSRSMFIHSFIHSVPCPSGSWSAPRCPSLPTAPLAARGPRDKLQACMVTRPVLGGSPAPQHLTQTIDCGDPILQPVRGSRQAPGSCSPSSCRVR